PVNAALSSGTRTFNVTLNTLGTQTLTASDITNTGKTANTSPSIRVTGPFVKLQLLVPGETAAPGPGSGKAGTPLAQGPGTLFTVLARPIFDAASSLGGSATPLTWSHTVAAGSNRLLIVGVSTGDIIATHDSVTYNTAPMTKITEVTGASDRVSIWKLVNPAT